MGLARFRILVSAGEPLAVEFNGVQLPEGLYVTGFACHLVNGIPQLSLAVSGDAVIEGEGIIVVERESTEDYGADYGAELCRIIDSLDEDEIERKSMEHAPTLDSKVGYGVKEALKEMIGGSVGA